MAEQTKRQQRTWSAFGEVRRMPTEYGIVSHGTNSTLRDGRKAPLEQNPSSPANMWFRTFRDQSPPAVEDWSGFLGEEAGFVLGAIGEGDLAGAGYQHEQSRHGMTPFSRDTRAGGGGLLTARQE